MKSRKKLGMGELEAKVMDVLWAAEDDWLTPADVHRALSRRRPLAYTTVMTVLVRLNEKGVVNRRRDGRAYAYRPVQTRDEDAAARMREILAAAGDRSAALSRFLASLSPSERAQLRRLLRPSR
ncbi:MAG: BlaI/MecI/CopY family transcriptional regulator [Acidimicrobiia bacterium]